MSEFGAWLDTATVPLWALVLVHAIAVLAYLVTALVIGVRLWRER